MSEKSSQFSTPDDHFQNPDPSEERVSFRLSFALVWNGFRLFFTLQQFVVDDLTSRSQSYEFLKPVALQISSLSKVIVRLISSLGE